MNFNTETEKIIDKIKGLLALSASTKFEHEAEAALLKAQRLMAEYSLSMAQVNQEGHGKKGRANRTILGIKASGMKWVHNLMFVIEENFRVKAYFHGGYVSFIGLGEDSELAGTVFSYTYDYATKRAEHHYRNALILRGTGVGVKHSYLNGFVLGLEQKFRDQRRKMQQESKSLALVLVRDSQVDMEYEQMMKDRKPAACPGRTPEAREYYVMMGYAEGTRLPDIHSVLGE